VRSDTVFPPRAVNIKLQPISISRTLFLDVPGVGVLRRSTVPGVGVLRGFTFSDVGVLRRFTSPDVGVLRGSTFPDAGVLSLFNVLCVGALGTQNFIHLPAGSLTPFFGPHERTPVAGPAVRHFKVIFALLLWTRFFTAPRSSEVPEPSR